MFNLNFRGKILFGQVFVLIIFIIFSAVVFFIANDIKNQKVAMLESNYRQYKVSARIKFDVVQIQQWLTDISATRGEDGLNDGHQKAKEFYTDLLEVIKEEREFAKSQNDKEMVVALGNIKELIDSYYAVGVKMSNLYVKEGTKAGNGFMAQFDTASENLQVKLNPLLTQIENKFDQGVVAVKIELN